MIIKSIGEVFRELQWKSAFNFKKHTPYSHAWWFWSMHFPYIMLAFAQSFYKPLHKNVMFNTVIYDGMTRNEFEYGSLMIFLNKIGAIKKYNHGECPDMRGYFIGYADDDDN